MQRLLCYMLPKMCMYADCDPGFTVTDSFPVPAPPNTSLMRQGVIHLESLHLAPIPLCICITLCFAVER